MNRIDRLFGILLLLQRKSTIRAEDIAKRYDITVRTVYRDIASLHELGVPILSIPGEGYSIMEGFYLPPLIFTADEASALFLGGRLLALQADGHLPDSTSSALSKIRNILPAKVANHVNQLDNIIHFTIAPRKFNLDDKRLLLFQQAIVNRVVVRIQYHSLKEDALTQRDIEPLQLTYGNQTWYITAFCRLRQDIRQFRLNRIQTAQPLTENFMTKVMPASMQTMQIVKIKVPFSQARWIRERQHYGFISETYLDDEALVMTYEINNVNEIKAWIMSWGARVQIIAPKTLVSEIRDELNQLLALLT